MRPSPHLRPSLHCRHCGRFLLAPGATPRQLHPCLVRIIEGTLWVQCAGRRCRQWCPAPERLRAVLRAAVALVGEAVRCVE